MLNVLILAGGVGKRLFPISTTQKPKQFLQLVSEKTMLQITFERINKLVPLNNIFICTNIDYIHYIKEQIPNFKEENIIAEPQNKNTMAAITLSSFVINQENPNSNILVIPSDHMIDNFSEFEKIIKQGNNFLNKDNEKILTFGIKPNSPSINYGYIKYDIDNDETICKVKCFKEKPDLELATKYIKSKEYLWNSGMIMSNITTLLQEIKKYNSTMYKTFDKIKNHKDMIDFNNYLKEKYPLLESISIDYSLLEKSKNIYVVYSDLKWKDIGSFEILNSYLNS